MPETGAPSRLPTNQVFDVLVIGGGITGAWTALDCTLRGLSTVLVEKADFGSATSMRSSRLLHGGIRYLQQLEFGKVRESSRERSFLTRSAPHLVKHIPFVVPTYPGIRQGRAFLYSGMLAYRILALGTSAVLRDPATRAPSDRGISRQAIKDQGLIHDEAITGGRILYEAQVHSSERMTLGVIERARASGAVALNYAVMDHYRITDNKVSGVWVRDLIDGEAGEIRSQIVINAAGPWCDHVNQTASLHRLNTGFARGAHILTRALLNHYAVALPSAFQSDGLATRGHRHVFVIPWRNRSLIGTSYMESDEPSDSLVPTDSEISQLVDTVNSGLPQAKLSHNDVLQSFVGYYPLQSASIRQGVYQGTGEYRLVDHALTDGTEGLVTALGAKFTTARRLGEMAAQLAEKKIGRTAHSRRYPTRNVQIQGGDIADLASFQKRMLEKYSGLWSESTCRYLISCYGSRIHEIAKLCRDRPALNRPLAKSQDTIAAQVVYAATSESVMHLTDILLRRTDLCLLGHPGDPVLNDCAELAAATLGWSENQRLAELELIRTELARSIPAAPTE
ncbi:MAG TPA: hypothetical protein DHW07_05960 [Gammaproteobacteria bacterium]|nr:hypothetical protein [Gammaproteobacteria bacterium]